MSFLDRAIKSGISKGISNAVGNAVKQAVEPKATAYANKVAGELDQAAQNISQHLKDEESGFRLRTIYTGADIIVPEEI